MPPTSPSAEAGNCLVDTRRRRNEGGRNETGSGRKRCRIVPLGTAYSVRGRWWKPETESATAHIGSTGMGPWLMRMRRYAVC